MLFLELVKSVPQRCYLARYLYFACNKPKTFIDVKKLPSSKGLSQLIIYLVKKRRNTATTVESGVTAAPCQKIALTSDTFAQIFPYLTAKQYK